MIINRLSEYLYKFRIFILALVLFPVVTYQFSYLNNGKKREFKFKIFKGVIDSLVKLGVDSEYVVALVNDYRTHFNERFASINIISQPKLELTNILDGKALLQIRSFIETNFDILSRAENKFQIPKEIISIILWIETRFGKNLGKNHLPSVFLSMATATNPYVLENLISTKTDGTTNKDSVFQNYYQRARNKENFALNELVALISIQKRGMVDVYNLYGSYSGAFGIPQFLPTSYLKYGYDGNGDGKVDLFNLDDAIFSVANYLAQNGWKWNDTNSYFYALFKYNRSKQYVESILDAYKELKKSQ